MQEDHIRYQQIAYPSQAIPETNPDRLAAIACLAGLDPPALTGARVLELGCGDGTNLLPLAAYRPTTEFVGVDIAVGPVEAAAGIAADLGLRNAHFVRLDVRDIPGYWGSFQFIIAHGLYSWVAPSVQAATLAAIGRHLSTDGLAYVSFAAYPGWHYLNQVRDLLRYVTRDIADPLDRARLALEQLARLADSPADETNAPSTMLAFFARFLQQRVTELGTDALAYTVHDTLAPVHHPVYLHQFASEAAAHGLQVISDVDLSTTLAAELPATLRAAVGDRTGLEGEQLLDFHHGRSFHRLLLARQPGQPLGQRPRPRLHELRFGTLARAASSDQRGQVAFAGDDGAVLPVADPSERAVVTALTSVRPGSLAIDDLALALGHQTATIATADLLAIVWRLHVRDARLVSVHREPVSLSDVPPTCPPRATSYARWQARHGAVVTTGQHTVVDLSEVQRRLLPQLDGERDLASLRADWREAMPLLQPLAELATLGLILPPL